MATHGPGIAELTALAVAIITLVGLLFSLGAGAQTFDKRTAKRLEEVIEHLQNDRFNELLLLAKAELDEKKRAEMYHEMCMLARDDGGTIIPMFVNFVYARRKNVQHGESVAASWECDGARGTSRWWFTD